MQRGKNDRCGAAIAAAESQCLSATFKAAAGDVILEKEQRRAGGESSVRARQL
jgi:hypothetical protein